MWWRRDVFSANDALTMSDEIIMKLSFQSDLLTVLVLFITLFKLGEDVTDIAINRPSHPYPSPSRDDPLSY